MPVVPPVITETVTMAVTTVTTTITTTATITSLCPPRLPPMPSITDKISASASLLNLPLAFLGGAGTVAIAWYSHPQYLKARDWVATVLRPRQQARELERNGRENSGVPGLSGVASSELRSSGLESVQGSSGLELTEARGSRRAASGSQAPASNQTN